MIRPGLDSPFDQREMKVGRRLALKVLNASKFVLERRRHRAEPLGSGRARRLSLLGGLASTITRATEAFEAYDYTTALEVTEQFFWQFCDDYLELVKERAYGARGDGAATSAKAALAIALHAQLRLFAPILPYVTEEVWSWWKEGSMHRQPWPSAGDLGSAAASDPAMLGAVAQTLGGIRGAKSQAKVSMRTELSRVAVSGPAAAVALAEKAADDLRAAGRITGELTFTPSDDASTTEISVDAEVAPQEPAPSEA